MTNSNRLLNRALLLLIGLAAFAPLAVLVMTHVPGVSQWVDARELPGLLPDLSAPSTLWIIAAVALVVVLLALAWILTRGRGRTPFAFDAGDIQIDDSAVASLLRLELAGEPDVLSVAAHGYRRASGTVLVRIEGRTRSDVGALLTHVRTAVAAADRAIGAPVPLVIHLTTGIRTAMTGSRSTQ